MATWVEKEYITSNGERGKVRMLVTSPVQLARVTSDRGRQSARRSQPAATVEDLAARVRANELQLRGLELEQAEIAQRQRADADGTTALQRLEHQASLIRLEQPALSNSAALALACQRNPELYAEHTSKRTAHVGATVTVTRKDK